MRNLFQESLKYTLVMQCELIYNVITYKAKILLQDTL